MTDKKLTDKEILKAFECCYLNNPCEECPLCELQHAEKQCFDGDVYAIPRMIVDLINRLQIENETVKALNGRLVVLADRFRSELKTAKAEAYKEFAELLHCQCESIINQPHNENVRPISWKAAYEEFDEKIDNLLKELEGDNNAGNETAS